MPRRHVVQSGDSIDSLAFEHGFAPSTLWDHPENQKLKELRTRRNVLSVGDEVFIPDRQEKWAAAATGHCHRFRRKEVPAKFRLQLLEGFLPRSDQPFRLSLPEREIEGTTDADGWIEVYLPNDVIEADLYVGEDPPFTLLFGHLEPADTIRGVQQRLNNLGFDCGEETGDVTPETRQALTACQRHWGLTESGAPDEETMRKIETEHDRDKG